MNNDQGNNGFNFIDMNGSNENSCGFNSNGGSCCSCGGNSCSCGGGCSCNPCNPCDDCCDDIIRLLRRILWNIKDLECCDCDQILRLLWIIIRLLRKQESNGCCICDSDNKFKNEEVTQEDDNFINFINLESGDRRITAITAVYDSHEAKGKPATGMTLAIVGGGGPVYSQYIGGSIPSRQVGSLTIAFTHPIYVPDRAKVKIKLHAPGAGEGDPNAFVSVNVASCPVEEEQEEQE